MKAASEKALLALAEEIGREMAVERRKRELLAARVQLLADELDALQRRLAAAETRAAASRPVKWQGYDEVKHAAD